jgi:dTDP-4-dehydrorhamnose reductase
MVPSEVNKLLQTVQPSVIVHLAAFCNTGLCEKDPQMVRIYLVMRVRS